MKTLPEPRAALREARLLSAVTTVSGMGSLGVGFEEVVAIDFLLSHPSVLDAYLQFQPISDPSFEPPASDEIASSEEAWLPWKRAESSAVVAPLISRLLARGLVEWLGDGLRPTELGAEVAAYFTGSWSESDSGRVVGVAFEIGASSRRTYGPALLAAVMRAADGD